MRLKIKDFNNEIFYFTFIYRYVNILLGDNMKFAVVEVGSTNTKAYIYNNDKIKEIPMVCIEFKNNYKKNNKIIDSDIKKLYDYILKIKKETNDIHIYGTSIFRQLEDDERDIFLSEFKENTGYDFNIVSANLENEYTVMGVVNNIDYQGRIAVMIGGGGSTELSIVENKKIIEQANSNFGAMDVTHAYPDLKDDKASTTYEEMLVHIKTLTNNPYNKADILVLAGGSYIMFYETLHYKLDKNNIYDNVNQPFIIDRESMEKYDIDFLYNKSLDKIKEKNPDYSSWWDGARGMRLCVEVIADIVDAKYIIPTKINMILGIISKIKEEMLVNN
jgi:exopolyphosphatase/pppGpp-phosphohydrolase